MSERWKEYFSTHKAFGSNWLQAAVPHWGFHEILYGNIQRYCPAGGWRRMPALPIQSPSSGNRKLLKKLSAPKMQPSV